ncbi:FAD-dependent oxidoreductase, partial [Acinetobacter baumannii]|nr:FAD-dependent oxidoreductase [Acinetobacter baumannii]
MTMHTDETATYYTATKKYFLNFPQLEQDIDADVVIIGGGFSGIHTALELAEQGVKNIVVLEGRYLGFGGSGRNGGQVMAGIGHDLDNIKHEVGEEGLKTIFELSELGPQIMRERIQKYNIDADFTNGYTYLGFNSRQAKTLKSWEKQFKTMNNRDEIYYLEGKDV